MEPQAAARWHWLRLFCSSQRCARDLPLALYAADGVLPAHSQLLVCGVETTVWKRSRRSYIEPSTIHRRQTRERLFCVLFASAALPNPCLHFKERLERLYASVHPRRMRLALISDEREQHRVSSDLALVRLVEPAALSHTAVEEALRGDRHVLLVTSEQVDPETHASSASERVSATAATLRMVPISGHLTRNELVEDDACRVIQRARSRCAGILQFPHVPGILCRGRE